MSGSVLHLRSVRVHRMPGVPMERAFALEQLQPGVNVVYGPNGCGKTTTARAIQELLWPGNAGTPPPVAVAGNLQHATESWELEIEGSDVRALCNGHAVTAPQWSSPDRRKRYWWALQELVTGQDEDLAHSLAALMQGGVDLQALARELNLDRPLPQPKALQNRLREAKTRVRAANERQQTLDAALRSCPPLEVLDETSRSLRSRTTQLDDAIQACALRRQEQELRSDLQRFAPVFSRLRAEDADLWERTIRRLDELMRERDHLQTEHARLVEAGHRLVAWTGDDFQQLRLRMARLLRDAAKQDAALREAERDLGAARTRRAAVESQLGGVPRSDLPHTDSSLRDHLRLFMRLQEAQARAEQLTDARNAIPDQPERALPPPDSVRDGLAELSRWLGSPVDAESPGLSPPFLALGLASFAGPLLAAILHHPGWLILIPLPFICLYLELRTLSRRAAKGNPRLVCEARYRETGLPLPEGGWTVESVTRLLGDLHALEELRSARRQRDALSVEIERQHQRIQEDEAQLANASARFASASGLTPTPDPAWLGHALQDLQRWRTARDEELGLEQTVRDATAAREEVRNALATTMAPYRALLPAEVDTLEGEWDLLLARLDEEEKRRAAETALSQRLEQLDAEHRRLQEDRAALLKRLEIRDQDAVNLKSWVEALPAYEEQFRLSEQVQARASDYRKRLASDPALLDADPAWLETERERVERDLQHTQQQRDRCIELHAQHESFRNGREIAQALEEVDRLQAELEAQREAQLDNGAGMALLAWLRSTVVRRDQPRVLTRANEWLAKFTQGQLQVELGMDGEAARLHVRRNQGRVQQIGELSTGERVQVLIAVRLAFVELDEAVALPLIVDEALGNSDEVRENALMDHWISLARDGRQIFYFTAKEVEVSKWQARLQEAGVPYGLFALEQLRAGQEAQEHTLPDVPPARHQPPEPVEGESHQAYGHRLGVPACDLTVANVASLHVWHFFDEPRWVYALLQRHVATWSAVETLLAGGVELPVPAKGLDQGRAMAVALATAAEACRIGRGRRVFAEELASTNLLAGATRDRVLQRLADLNGDAEALMQGIEEGEIRGMHATTKERLRAGLIEMGGLSEELRLTPDQINARVQHALQERGLTLHPERLARVLACIPD